MSVNVKKQRPSLSNPSARSSNRRFLPVLRQSLFARARLRRKVLIEQGRLRRPSGLADVAQMLRRMTGAATLTGNGLTDESSVSHSQVLFEALEPRILLSADIFVPPPSPDTFDDNPQQDDVILPPSELDEEIINQLPDEDVDTLEPAEEAQNEPPEEIQLSDAGILPEAANVVPAPEGAFVDSVRVIDADQAPTGDFTIKFGEQSSYQVFAEDGALLASGALDAETQTIIFSGLEITIGGEPQDGTLLGFNLGADGELAVVQAEPADLSAESGQQQSADAEQPQPLESIAADADAGDDADHGVADSDAQDVAIAEELAPATAGAEAEKTLQIVFVDAAVKDYQSLVDQIVGDQTRDFVEPQSVVVEAGSSSSIDEGSEADQANDQTVDDKQSTILADSLVPADGAVPVRVLSTAGSNILVYVIQSDEDGVQQISDVLSAYSGVDGVHILSHGAAGALMLGNTRLSSNNLEEFEDQLNGWSGSLSEQADIQLYGCNIAEGEQGAEFIQNFSEATGADVAASIDETGNAADGGNWELEFTTGLIESSIIADSMAPENYAYLLAAPSGVGTTMVMGSSGGDHWRLFDSGATLTLTDVDSSTDYVLTGVGSGTTLTIDLGAGADTLVIDSALDFDFNLVLKADVITVTADMDANGNDITLAAEASSDISAISFAGANAASVTIDGATLTGNVINVSADSSMTDSTGTPLAIIWNLTSSSEVLLENGASIDSIGNTTLSASTDLQLSATPNPTLISINTVNVTNVTQVRVMGGSGITSSAGNIEISATDRTQIDVLPEDASYFSGGVATALGLDDMADGALGSIDMDAVSINVDLDRTTSVLIDDTKDAASAIPAAEQIDAAAGSVAVSATNQGGINANIVSDAIGLVSNTVVDIVNISVFDSTISAQSVSLVSSSEAIYSAQGKVLSNDVSGEVSVDVDPSDIVATAGGITISATDSIEVLALTSESALDLGLIEDFFIANGSTFDSIDVDVIFAFNSIDRDVRAAVFDGSSLSSTGGDIEISATRNANIEADAKATSLSEGSTVSSATLSFSGGGTFSQNTILGNTEAYVENSTVQTTTSGDVKVTATDESRIDAKAYADSAVNVDAADTKTVGSKGSGALAVGVSIAQNTIGWETQNLLGSALDDLLGDSLLGDARPSQVQAYIADSDVVAAGAVSVAAMSVAQINSTVSNSVSSTSSTLAKGNSMGVSGLLSGNKVNTDVSAFIAEEISYDFSSDQGMRALKPGDRVQLASGEVFQYMGAAADVDLDEATQIYAGNLASWTPLALDAAITQIVAGGDVSVTASDESGIFANSKVVSSSITTNDGGAGLSNDIIGYLLEVEYVSDGADVSADAAELDPGVSPEADPTMIDLKFGDRVRLTSDFPASGSGQGKPGSVYEYLGSGTVGTPDVLDLAEQDFTNLDLWKEIPATQIIPEGNNLTDSDSVSIGGMAVLNDVRGEVQAWVNDATITVTDGDINVKASDAGVLKATADSTSESSGGSAYGSGNSIAVNGTISTNVLQGSSTAWVVDSTLTTINSDATGSDDIRVEAVNSANLNATTLQSTTTGDTGASFLIAFNSVGWESQNILFNSIDALIGNRIGTQSVSAATAYIQDSDIHAADDLNVLATSDSTLKAELSNESTAAASALLSATASSYAGILASNAVSGAAEAYIDNSNVAGAESINAGGSVNVAASDSSVIDAKTGLLAPTSSSNDLGVGQLNSLAKTLLDDYQYSSESEIQTLNFGDRVRVSSVFYAEDHLEADTAAVADEDKVLLANGDVYVYSGAGIASPSDLSDATQDYANNSAWTKLGGQIETVYQYMGTDAAVIDLYEQDYSNKDLWKKLNETNIIPKALATTALKATGIDGAAGGSEALGGLVSRNDVRAQVNAWINQASVTTLDGDINVTALENAQIKAVDTSVVSAGSDAKAGVIVNNLVLANAEAKVTAATLDAQGATLGNVKIEAMNEAVIDALAHGSVSGGKAIGFTIAFNTIGWDAQDIFTQTIDAIIGAPYLAQIGDPDFIISGTDINGSGSRDLASGDIVEIDADLSGVTTGGAFNADFEGELKQSYIWQGDAANVDLLNQDFEDGNNWRKVLLTDVFGGLNPSGAKAFVLNSEISTADDLDVKAISAVQLASDVSSSTKSEKANNAAVRAKYGVSSSAAGGLISGNKVATEAIAFIDNNGISGTTVDAIDVGGDLTIFASDTPGDNDVVAIKPAYVLSDTDGTANPVSPRDIIKIDDAAKLTTGSAEQNRSYRYIGGGVENIILQQEDFTNTDRWELLRPAGIEATMDLEVVSSATNDITALKGLANFLGLDDYEFTTISGSKALEAGSAEQLASGEGVDPYSVDDGFLPRLSGDRVYVSGQHLITNADASGSGFLRDASGDRMREGIYEYVGAANTVDLFATDYSDETLWNRLGQQDFEDILFPQMGNVSESNSTAAGGMVVMNEVRGNVEAYINDAELDVEGDIDIQAMEDASIRALMKSNVSSSGGSALGEGESLAYQGQIVTNLVLSSADAYIQDSLVKANGTSADGNLTIRAENSSLLDATLLASTQTGDTAVGVSLAFNTIGWKPQNVLFNAIDALLGDPLISEAFDLEQPARTEAYILNSNIVVAGNLEIDAIANTQLNATVSNAAESAASALKGAGGAAYGGVLASNKVSSNARAYIDFDTVDFQSSDGETAIRNGDWVQHGADIYEYGGRAETLDLSNTEQDYAQSNNWTKVLLPVHGVATDIDAGDGVRVNAEDNSGIYSNIKLVLSSITTNDGGASAIQETISDVVPVDYDTGNTVFTDVLLQFGDRVRLSDTHSAGGEAGAVYRYMGEDLLAGNALTLADEDYSNLNLWKLEAESDIVPDGINVSDSNSLAAGGMVVVNDVRTGVDAFINESVVDVFDGDIDIGALENATIRAIADSSAESSGGNSVDGTQGSSNAMTGTITTNVVQGSAQAYITESTVNADDIATVIDFNTAAGTQNITTGQKVQIAAGYDVGSAEENIPGRIFKFIGSDADGINSDLSTLDFSNDSNWVELGIGSIQISAVNTSTLDAITKQSTTSGGDATTVLVAFNSIGWQEQNILFNTIDALLGTPIGNENPSMASAFIEDSVLSADGELMLEAKNAATLIAEVSNESTASSAAVTGSTAKSYAGVLAANRVSSGAEAYIANPNVATEMVVGGDVSITASDEASIDAKTHLKSATSANNDAGTGMLNDLINNLFGSYDFTSSSGTQSVAMGDKVRVNSADYVEANTPLTLEKGQVVTFDVDGSYRYDGASLTTGGPKDLRALFDAAAPGEWVKLNGEPGRLYEYMGSAAFDYTTLGQTDPFTLSSGDVVRVDVLAEIEGLSDLADLLSSDSDKIFYRYIGADLSSPDLSSVAQNYTTSPDWVVVPAASIDLAAETQDYDNKDVWKLLSDDNIVPKKIMQVLLKEAGLAKKADDATGLGGLAARNDVRSGVDAFIIDTQLKATDGNIVISAQESASIVAHDQSIITAPKGADSGFIVNNLVLSSADAFIQDSTVKALDFDGSGEQGNLKIDAANTSTIDAYALGSVSGGDAMGFTLAFNTLGWDAQDLLTQSIDAIIGAPYIAEASAPDAIIKVGGTASQDMDFRDTVKLENISAAGVGFSGAGEEGKLYEWQGTAEEGLNLNLLAEDYLDTDRWRQVLDIDVFGGVNPSSARAYIQDSAITTDGDLTLNAVSEAQLSAEISNASKSEKTSTFAIAAKHGVSSAAAGAMLVGNKVASQAQAYIDNSGLAQDGLAEINVGGDLSISASDTAGDNDAMALEPAFKSSEFTPGTQNIAPRDVVQIDDPDALVNGSGETGYYRFIAAEATDVDLQNEDFTDATRWQLLRAAGIEALLSLEVFSSSTNNVDSLKGAAALLGLNSYEYTTSSGSQSLVDAIPADEANFVPRLVGDRVWVSQAYIDSLVGSGLSQGIYEYTGEPNTVLDLATTNYADATLWDKMDNQDFEDILFPNIGNLTDSNSSAIGGMVVMNDVRGEVEAYISDAEVLADGDIDVVAVEDSSIRAIAKSTVSSSGGSAFGEGESVARQGQIVTNMVLSKADAYIANSEVDTTGTAAGSDGSVTLRAENAALLDATLRASTQTGDTAAGISLAFNSVGWKPQNILFNTIDAILGDPLISSAFDGQDPARANAYISNSDIDVDGSVDVQALNNAQLNATTSNAAESNASALKGASGKAWGGMLSSNKIIGEAKAWIDGSSTILAGGGVSVAAEDNTGIFANTKLVSSSITTNDGGASAIQETLNDAVPVDFDTGSSNLSAPVNLKFGDRIRLSDSFTADAVTDGNVNAQGNDGSIYVFLGDDTAGTALDLKDQDYTNLDLFKEALETNLVPQGFNVSDSNSQAIGGLIVVNDVRAEVEAFIDGGSVTAEDGDIDVIALENATIMATTDGSVISSGGSALGSGESMAVNGILATNLVQSMAKAWARDNTLTARDLNSDDGVGNILIDAKNTSVLNATTKGSTQSGDSATGVVLAFNSVGWKSSNVLFNSVDALLGDPIISDAFDGAGNGAVEAYLQDVIVAADGDLTVQAKSASSISAMLSNDSTSAASALTGANGSSVGVILASNKVNSSAQAYIDNSGTANNPLSPDIITGGDVTVRAIDNASIVADTSLKAESTVTNDFGASAVADIADSLLDAYSYTTRSGEQYLDSGDKVRVGSIAGGADHTAGGRTGSIFSYQGPAVDFTELNTPTNVADTQIVELADGSRYQYSGAGLSNVLLNDETQKYATNAAWTAVTKLNLSDDSIDFTGADWKELNPVDFDSSEGMQTVTTGIAALDFLPAGLVTSDVILGTVVRVADGTPSGEVGSDYRFVGGDMGASVSIDLSAENYDNTDRWVKVVGKLSTILDSTVVSALSLNVSDSNSSAVGALFVMNDVRSDVDAFIDGAAVETGGDINVQAVETATITATDTSVVTSDGGSITGKGSSTAINGVVATNVVLSSADAVVKNSDLSNITGNVGIDAKNTSDIDAVIDSSTKSKGTSVGVTLAFNSIGWESQNFLFNTIDALIGTDIGDEQPASVNAAIMNTEVVAGGGIGVDALSNAQIDAKVVNANTAIVATVGDSDSISVGAIVTMNRLSTGASAVISEADQVRANGGDIRLSAIDSSIILADVEASALSVAVSKKSTGVSVGASIARNQINNDLDVRVENIDGLAAADGLHASGDIVLHAMETALIDASSVATAVSVGVSVGGDSNAFSGGLATANNVILGASNAGIIGSSVTATGNVEIDALNSSTINAVIKSTSVAVGVSTSGTSMSGSIGISIARNLIAFDDAFNFSSEGLDDGRYDFSSELGEVASVVQGDRVRLDTDSGSGLAGQTYEYTGAAELIDVDLSSINYGTGDWALRVENVQSLKVGDIVKLEAEYDAAKGEAGELYQYTGPEGNVDIGLADYTVAANWQKVEESNGTTPVQVHAYIQNSDVDVDGFIELDARSIAIIDATVNAVSVAVAASTGKTIGLSGAGVYTQNKIATSVKAFINGDKSPTTSAGLVQADGANAAGDGLSLHAADNSTISANTLAASVAGSLGASDATAVSIGLSLAFNTIANDVAAYIMNVDDVDIANDVAIRAISNASITANSTAASVAVAIGGGNTIAVSGGAAIAQNVILSTTNAFTDDSQLNVGTAVITSGIDIDASSSSNIEARVIAGSASVAVGSSNSIAASIGMSVARNFIGWNPSAGGSSDYDSNDQGVNLRTGDVVEVKSGARDGDFYQYVGEDKDDIDMVVEDYGNTQMWKLISLSQTPDQVQVQAYMRDTGINATGAVTLDAHGDEVINALTVAGSVAIAAGGSTSVGASAAGVYTENRIRSHIKAFIDGGQDNDTSDTLNAASVELHASDSAHVESNAAAVSVAAGIGSTGVAVSIGISLAFNEVTNQVDAFLSNIDSGIIVGDLVIDAKSLPNVSVAEDYTTLSGTQTLNEGDLVKVANGYNKGGDAGRIYQYRGYAEFLSSDGGSNFDDPATPSDDSYELNLLTGSLIAEVDGNGDKTGRIFELTAAGYDEDNPFVIGKTQTINGILTGGSFDTDARFVQYQVDLGNADYSDSQRWELADATILARSAAASLAVGVGSTGVAISGAGALALREVRWMRWVARLILMRLTQRLLLRWSVRFQPRSEWVRPEWEFQSVQRWLLIKLALINPVMHCRLRFRPISRIPVSMRLVH